MAKFTGDNRWREKMKNLSGPALHHETRRFLYAAADMIRADAKQSITKGAVSGKGHIPSRPGQPPNADTHHLDTNIITQVVDDTHAEIISTAAYSAFLEYGTSRMAERPFMRPAAQRNAKKVADMLGHAVGLAVRRS